MQLIPDHGSGSFWPKPDPDEWCAFWSSTAQNVYPSGIAGPRGPQGLQGPQGPPGGGFDASCADYSASITTTDTASHLIQIVALQPNSAVFLQTWCNFRTNLYSQGGYYFAVGLFGCDASGKVLALGPPNIISGNNLGATQFTITADPVESNINFNVKGNASTLDWSIMTIARTVF